MMNLTLTLEQIEEYALDRFQNIYNASVGRKQDEIYYKALILKSLLTQDEKLFKEILKKKNLEIDLKDNFFFKLEDKKLIWSLELRVKSFQIVLANEDEQDLLLILMNMFHSIPELSFSGFANNCMSMKDKKMILSKIIEPVEEKKKNFVKLLLTDLSYDPSLPAFRPSIRDSSYIQSKISSAHYESIVSKKPDISEFIILTIGFLRSHNLVDEFILQKLSVEYLFVNYETCLSLIQDHFELVKNKENKQIIKYLKNLREFESNKNDPRRFFETRLSQYINGLTHSKDTLISVNQNDKDERYNDEALRKKTLISVNKILNFFLGEYYYVDNPKNMEQNISVFAQRYKDQSKFLKKDIEFITSLRKHERIIFKGSDRIAREEFTQILERKHEKITCDVGANVWNSSGGILKGISPTFSDALCEPIRNMLVDSSQVEEKCEHKHQWYWNNNRQYAAYVGSVSGHACEVVGMLSLYLEEHANDKDVEQDLHLFLVQLIAVYIKRGYHSVLEVADILHDELIQELFKKYEVTIDLYQYFQTEEASAYLKYAMNDALHYTQVLVNKRQIASEVKNFSFFTQEKKHEINNNNLEIRKNF